MANKITIYFMICLGLMILDAFQFRLKPTKSFCNIKTNLKNTIYLDFRKTIDLKMSNKITEFESEESISTTDATKTDLETGKTHGYEGDYKIGDKVRVISDIRLWHVKEYAKEGFLCKGFEGEVVALDLYGRKMKSLCSAITPVVVEFQKDGKGIPSGMFEKKFRGHFAGEELEKI